MYRVMMKNKKHFIFSVLVVLGVLSMQAHAADISEPTPPADLTKYTKVAVLHWAPPSTILGVSKSKAEEYKQTNRETIADYVREAAANGATFIVTPEFGIVGYPDIPELPSEEDEFRNRDDIAPYVEVAKGPSFKYFSKIAKELKVTLEVGFAEVDPSDDKYYNLTLVIGPKGEFVTSYRKINLFEAENDFLSPGTTPVQFKSEMGLVGMGTCSDIYSWDILGAHQEAKVDVFSVAMSWAREGGPKSFAASAAKRLNVPVLISNNDWFPGAGVLSKDGKIQSWIADSSGLAYGYVLKKANRR